MVLIYLNRYSFNEIEKYVNDFGKGYVKDKK
jgi:hypothetical protein